jgi:3-(3-hydroxy-phenyl)propionate hydroxylase
MNAYVSDPVDWSAIFKMPHEGPPGLWRVLFPTDSNVPEEEVLDAGFIERAAQNFLPWDRPYGIVHKSTYRVHQRVASDFRQGRFLLVGDAAHLNNPLGAFGLNGALHAAFNLAPKLTSVWRGEAPEILLDQYVRQRRAANVEFVQAQSIHNKQLLEERDPTLRAERLDALRRIASDPKQQRDYLLKSSMIWSVRHAAAIA